MIDLTADIIPYHSLAQLQLGDDIEIHREELSRIGCELLKNTFSNQNFGMVLWLATPYDELYDHVSELPDHAVIDAITIGNYDEWKFFC